MDRASRYTILLYLPGRHTAEAVRDALITAFSQLPPQLRRSLTWDQGKEMALHQEVTAALGMPVYFCDKASPWQSAVEREHQRATPPVLTQGQRPARTARTTWPPQRMN